MTGRACAFPLPFGRGRGRGPPLHPARAQHRRSPPQSGIGIRPVSQSASSLSGNFQHRLQRRKLRIVPCALCAVAQSRPAGCRSHTSRGAWRDTADGGASLSTEADSGSLIGAVSYSGAITPCQPVDHDPLTPLFSPLTTLKGVGPTVGALIAKVAGGERVIDLLFHLPEVLRRSPPAPHHRRARNPARSSPWRSRWCGIEPPANTRQPWRVVVTDGTGFAELVFFKFNRERQMPVGAKLLVSGKVERFSGRRVISHPEHVVPADRPEQMPAIEPVWPLTGGLWPRQVAQRHGAGA